MNRRDLFKGLLGATAVYVVVGSDRPEYELNQYGPYDTDDAYYDQLLDEMLGEEWS